MDSVFSYENIFSFGLLMFVSFDYFLSLSLFCSILLSEVVDCTVVIRYESYYDETLFSHFFIGFEFYNIYEYYKTT